MLLGIRLRFHPKTSDSSRLRFRLRLLNPCANVSAKPIKSQVIKSQCQMYTSKFQTARSQSRNYFKRLRSSKVRKTYRRGECDFPHASHSVLVQWQFPPSNSMWQGDVAIQQNSVSVRIHHRIFDNPPQWSQIRFQANGAKFYCKYIIIDFFDISVVLSKFRN